jgi:hypothetical protein
MAREAFAHDCRLGRRAPIHGVPCGKPFLINSNAPWKFDDAFLLITQER